MSRLSRRHSVQSMWNYTSIRLGFAPKPSPGHSRGILTTIFLGEGKWGCKKYRRIPKCAGDWQERVPMCSLPRKTLQNKGFGAPNFEGSLPSFSPHSRDTPVPLYARTSPWPIFLDVFLVYRFFFFFPGNFRGTSGTNLSTCTVREAVGKSPRNSRGSSGQTLGSPGSRGFRGARGCLTPSQRLAKIVSNNIKFRSNRVHTKGVMQLHGS